MGGLHKIEGGVDKEVFFSGCSVSEGRGHFCAFLEGNVTKEKE